MKKGFRAATVLIIALLMSALLLGVTVGAVEDRTENRNLANEKYSHLMTIQTEYFSKGNAGKAANNYVSMYAALLNNLDDTMIGQDGTKEKILLYYEQAVVAGRVAYIYYSYAEDARLPDESREAIGDTHTNLQNRIFAATSSAELRSIASVSYDEGGLYAAMHVAVFNKLLNSLVREGDSDVIREIVAESKNEIKACTSVTESAEYEAIYEATRVRVNIQRNREVAIKEVPEILGVLSPNTSVSESPDGLAIIEFVNLESTTDASAINERLMEFAIKLLSEKKTGGAYVDAYVESLIELVRGAVNEANSHAETVMISTTFVNYTFNMKKAEAKDVIAADITSRSYAEDARLTELEALYNGKDGIIDRCSRLDELEFEKQRALVRVAIYGDLVEAKAAILGFGDFGDILDEADKKYAYYDFNVTNKADGDVDGCLAERADFRAELDALVIEAELATYRDRHKDVLSNDSPSLDKSKILAAIEGALSLSEGAAEIVEADGTIDKLCERYKQAAKNEIADMIADGNPDASTALAAEIDVLTVNGDRAKLTALISSVNVIVGKAECIDLVLDRLDEIKAGENYPSFSSENKAIIDKIADDAADAIVASAGGNEALEIKNNAITELNRAEAKALIDAKVDASLGLGDTTDETIKDIADAAKDKIEDLDDPDEIEDAIKDAIFDIEKEVDKNNTETESEKVKEEIEDKGFLTEEEKEEIYDEIDRVTDEIIGDIDSATNEEERDAVLDRFEEEIDKIKGEADLKNEDNKKVEAEAALIELKEKLDSTKEKINVLKFISDSAKAALLGEADSIYDKAASDIAASASSKTIASIKSSASKELDGAVTRAHADDKVVENTEKAALSATVKTEYDALIAKIDSLTYTTDLLRNELKIKAENALSTFTAENNSAADRGEMQAAQNEFASTVATLYTEIDAHELSSAKSWAAKGIKDQADLVKRSIVGFEHLDVDAKSNLIKEIDAKYAAAESHLELAPDIATVLSIKDLAIAAIANMEAEAVRLDDEAFVDQLAPLLIILATAFVIELTLVAVLLAYKKKTVCAAALPILAPTLALSPLGAEIIAVVLAIADLALAIYIGYLLSIICLSIRDKQSAEPTLAAEGLEAVEELCLDFGPTEREKEDPVIDYMKEPLVLDDPVDEITVEEAEELMSDEEAKELEQAEEDFVPSFREEYHGDKRAEINIDTIGVCFESGDKVTLNTLKDKGLVSRRAGYVKILGRGRLDKPLTVVAQKFSASAVKMIALTGGSAIVAEPSAERKRQQRIG